MRYATATALLLTLLSACQQKPISTVSPPAAEPAVSPKLTVTALSTVPPALSAEEQAFFKEYNLSALIAKEPDDSEIMNGFYGADHYRIEFAMLDVRRDPANPLHYFVRGKNRFKKAITLFEGDIEFTQLGSQAPLTKAPAYYSSKQGKEYITEANTVNAYSALGTFTLREDASYKGAGVFKGEVIVDFSVSERGELAPFTRDDKQNTRGGWVLFQGTWTNPETKQPKPVLWVQNIFLYQQDIFRDFTIGERDPDFNPKYARLGWDTYWQNDEWWAEPGTTIAQEPNTAEADPDSASAEL
ncbi:hypothetical protein [Hymenobacter fodinae]|uniref:Uncharacterized protein n=1 Tax=Hymenobacter fodinae TaxID=2510796 RepID=A0A4Z0P642_9BACT|nr:hypothetical protein [Hymenobacter fodinae]TGE06137.1 hypothetical protein EU556_14840 [Hymenobacter fodinae]